MIFADYIADNLHRPFVWGEHDCVLFAVRWISVATGKNPLPGLPSWSSARQAMRMVKELGGIEQLIDARFPRIHPNLAQDGDIALYDGCVCLFSGPCIVGPGKTGLERIDRAMAAAAWRVRCPK